MRRLQIARRVRSLRCETSVVEEAQNSNRLRRHEPLLVNLNPFGRGMIGAHNVMRGVQNRSNAGNRTNSDLLIVVEVHRRQSVRRDRFGSSNRRVNALRRLSNNDRGRSDLLLVNSSRRCGEIPVQ